MHGLEGDEEDLDPYWKWRLDQAEDVQRVRIFNRSDCCGNRLNNAILELHDEQGAIVYNRNLGAAELVKDVFFHTVYRVKEVKIMVSVGLA